MNGGGSLFSPSSQNNSSMFSPNNNNGGSMFSPNHNMNNHMSNNPSSTPASGYRGGGPVYEENDLFQSQPLITPSKQGDGASRRRSPYR